MKYFTYSWWAGENPEADDAIASKYHPYLQGILPELPDELQRFVRKCCLHDARLLQLDVLLDSHELHMELLGAHYGRELAPEDNIPDNYARRFWLTYRGVDRFTSTGNPKHGLGGPHGYGDLGYDELEILEPQLFEHRMIFSTSIEFKISFRDFSFKHEDFEYRRDA